MCRAMGKTRIQPAYVAGENSVGANHRFSHPRSRARVGLSISDCLMGRLSSSRDLSQDLIPQRAPTIQRRFFGTCQYKPSDEACIEPSLGANESGGVARSLIANDNSPWNTSRGCCAIINQVRLPYRQTLHGNGAPAGGSFTTCTCCTASFFEMSSSAAADGSLSRFNTAMASPPGSFLRRPTAM